MVFTEHIPEAKHGKLFAEPDPNTSVWCGCIHGFLTFSFLRDLSSTKFFMLDADKVNIYGLGLACWTALFLFHWSKSTYVTC